MNQTAFHIALESIRTDRQSGASELARKCLSILAESAYSGPANNSGELIQLLNQRSSQLAATRLSMAPIKNLINQWRANISLLSTQDLSILREQASATADKLINHSQHAVLQCAMQAAEHIGSNQTIFTHSLSSTVTEVFKRLQNQDVKAIITESRPLNEGYLLARQLSEWQIPTTLITDAQIGLFIAKADVVLVGADTLLADGSLINKAGTYPLALLAHEHGIPLYVCCESFKRQAEAAAPPELEAMNAAELQAPQLPGVTVQNIYFDVTPAHLINIWFDEQQMHPYPLGSTLCG